MPEACNFIKNETLAQVFSCEFCEIYKNTLFTEHLWTTAYLAVVMSFPNRDKIVISYFKQRKMRANLYNPEAYLGHVRLSFFVKIVNGWKLYPEAAIQRCS